MSMIERRQQVIGRAPRRWPEPRKVLPSTAMTRRCFGPGRVRLLRPGARQVIEAHPRPAAARSAGTSTPRAPPR